MTDIAKALDKDMLADVAAYYAGRPKRNPNPVTLAESPPAIVRLVELGDPSRNIPPCAACHRAGSGGPIETPILAEQGDEYLVAQLKLYASGERRNDVYGRMRFIAAQLTEAEISGLAAYYRAGFKVALNSPLVWWGIQYRQCVGWTNMGTPLRASTHPFEVRRQPKTKP